MVPRSIKLRQRLENVANFAKRFIPAHFPFTGPGSEKMLLYDRHRVNLAETGTSNAGIFSNTSRGPGHPGSHRKQNFCKTDSQSREAGNYHFTGSLKE